MTDLFEGDASGRLRWQGTRPAIYPGLGPPGGGKTLLLPLVVPLKKALVIVLLMCSPTIGRIVGDIGFLGYQLSAW